MATICKNFHKVFEGNFRLMIGSMIEQTNDVSINLIFLTDTKSQAQVNETLHDILSINKNSSVEVTAEFLGESK